MTIESYSTNLDFTGERNDTTGDIHRLQGREISLTCQVPRSTASDLSGFKARPSSNNMFLIHIPYFFFHRIDFTPHFLRIQNKENKNACLHCSLFYEMYVTLKCQLRKLHVSEGTEVVFTYTICGSSLQMTL